MVINREWTRIDAKKKNKNPNRRWTQIEADNFGLDGGSC